ncbi:MAG: Bacterial extracellular solute-binding protein, family 5 Middle [uncultured Acidilobus sp. JCHS]|jgi:Bacterial extracellular solute-binding proteins, family 5 Middle.|nr:MAG: Bacterial extracellular solute-binding protein, family 5 Middle [uncultured Acidilobus sp. JCHS]
MITLTTFTPSPGSYVLIYAGNGSIINTTQNFASLLYRYPGHYLVYYQVFRNGQLVGSSQGNLIEVLVAPPAFNSSFAQLITVPVITLVNLTEPIVSVGQAVHLMAGFLQPPSGTNMTIKEYVWDLGNGTTLAIPSRNGTGYAVEVWLTGSGNVTYLEPAKNPISVTYSSPGLYAVSLTVVTENITTKATYSYTTYYTIAVSSSTMPFSLFRPLVSVPNPGTIVMAENAPGGPFSFDPHIDYEAVGYEVILNVYGTLITYYGANTTKFIPMLAEYVPTVGNGINSNYTEYTFKLRPGLRASNGDPITAYDVWYSVVRDVLCSGGVPGTPGWILTQYLIPNYTPFTFVVTAPNDSQGAQEIVNAVTYDNATNTVTFHLPKPTSPEALFTALSMTLGGAVLDAKWLEQVGAGINFTGLYNHNMTQLAEAFYQYEQTCSEGNYNTEVQWPPPTAGFTGPYYVAAYTPGQSVVLKPNPYWPNNITYIPRPNTTVIIYWVKDPQTAYEMFASGQADIVTGLPSSYVPLLQQLEAKGQASLYEFPALAELFFAFNINVSQSALHSINPAYSIPSWYFANPLVREAFAYAFNYTQYINNILGNAKYHFNFGSPYCGALIQGLDYYIPPSELTGCPTFNLTYARQLMEESGFYNISVYFPIVIASGDVTDFTAAQMWAEALQAIDPNIHAQPIYMPGVTMYGYLVPGQNPMAIYFSGWIADYPLASDFANPIYLQGGFFTSGDGWDVDYLINLSAYFNASKISWPGLDKSVEPYIGKMLWQEAMQYQRLNELILKADEAELANNVTAAYQLFREAENIAIQLYMYVYAYQLTAHWVVKPYMHGYMGMISWEENPGIGGGGNSVYWWWVKG